MALTLGVIALVNIFGYVAVIWAFRASFRDLNTATWWFAASFAILAGAIIARGLWWDFAQPLWRLAYPASAAWWTEHVGREINILFALMKMAAFCCALKCRQMMIPEDERKKWPLWKAWLHPTGIKILPWR